MSDYDDYFSDDIVLDETVLAVLDAEETKFRQSQQHPRPSQPIPPPKRQKTDQGWKHTRPATQSDSFYDDLPEISISGDGSYGVLQSTIPDTVKAVAATAHVQPQSHANPRALSAKSSVAGPSNVAPNHPPSQGNRPQSLVRQPPPRPRSVQPPPPQSNRNFGRTVSQSAVSRQSVRPAVPNVPARINIPSRQPSSDESLVLRSQLEQVRNILSPYVKFLEVDTRR